jgi:hypothetical protein
MLLFWCCTERIWHNFDVVFAAAALYSIGPLEDMNIISIECVPQVFSVFLGYKVSILRLVDSFFEAIDWKPWKMQVVVFQTCRLLTLSGSANHLLP